MASASVTRSCSETGSGSTDVARSASVFSSSEMNGSSEHAGTSPRGYSLAAAKTCSSKSRGARAATGGIGTTRGSLHPSHSSTLPAGTCARARFSRRSLAPRPRRGYAAEAGCSREKRRRRGRAAAAIFRGRKRISHKKRRRGRGTATTRRSIRGATRDPGKLFGAGRAYELFDDGLEERLGARSGERIVRRRRS